MSGFSYTSDVGVRDMSFHEKSLWISLVGLVLCFGWYFGLALPGHGESVSPEQVVAFFVAVAVLVATQIAGHAVAAIVDRRTEMDERDRLIQMKGVRNGAYVLATGVFFSLCTAVMSDGNFWFTHVLLASWIVAQVVETGSQLAMHRRGA